MQDKKKLKEVPNTNITDIIDKNGHVCKLKFVCEKCKGTGVYLHETCYFCKGKKSYEKEIKEIVILENEFRNRE